MEESTYRTAGRTYSERTPSFWQLSTRHEACPVVRQPCLAARYLTLSTDPLLLCIDEGYDVFAFP